MHRLNRALLLVVLLTAACGGATSEQAIQTAIAETAAAVPANTATPDSTNTPLPPSPTPTAVPTERPTRTPVPTLPPAVIPEGWQTYTVLNGDFTIAYPDTWEVATENPSSVELTSLENDRQFLFFFSMDVTDPDEDLETQVRELKLAYLQTVSELDIDDFLEEGRLDTPLMQAYIAGRHIDYVYDEIESAFLVSYATDGAETAFVQFTWVGYDRPIPGFYNELMAQLVQAVDFEE